MATTSYLLGLGCNRPHGRHGRPPAVLAAALDALAAQGIEIVRASPVVRSRAVGSDRDFANAAAMVRSALPPPALLAVLKQVERNFGRRRGRRWGARVLDLDILVWEGGAWPPPPRASGGPLVIPHPRLAGRAFALGPAAAVAPGWRHPRRRVTLRQLAARLARARPVDPRPPRA